PTLTAPPAAVSGPAGSESDLETHIDQPPLDDSTGDAMPPALRAMIGAPLDAMLEIASSREAPGGVLVGIDTAVVLVGSSNWDAAAVRTALASVPEFGPLGRIAVEARGRVLIVANSSALAAKIVARLDAPASGQPFTYAATFHHAAERGRFLAMTRLIDYSDAQAEEHEPNFFSENIASL